MTTVLEATEYLSERAAPYGGDLQDILDLTPKHLWDSPSELMAYWEGRDLSHIFPQSQYPHLSNDWSNIIAEDPSINRGRGDEIMSPMDELQAHADNEAFANELEQQFTDDSPELLAELLEML